MKNAIFLLLFAATLGLFTCDKEQETVINGIVTDAKSGAPIAGAAIDYGLYQSGNNSRIYNTISDFEGKFQISFDKNHGLSGFSASKKGYLTRPNLGGEGVSYTEGKSNDVNLILHPLDGILRIIFLNSLPEPKKIYVQGQTITTRNVLGHFRTILTNPYPREVPSSSTIIADYPFPADEMVYLFWDTNNFDPLTPQVAAFSDSLFLAKNDTISFDIHL